MENTNPAPTYRQSDHYFGPDAVTHTISCLGDSLTAGYPYEDTNVPYPIQLLALLESRYGAGSFLVFNHGVSGYRTDQVLDDLKFQDWMGRDKPDLVLLMVGGNDLLQHIFPDGNNRDRVISQTADEVQVIVDTIRMHTNARGTRPRILVSAIPPNLMSGTYGSETAALYNQRLGGRLTGIDAWITGAWDDLYDPESGLARESLMADPVHPNPEGYAIMARNWFQAIQEIVSLTPAAHAAASHG